MARLGPTGTGPTGVIPTVTVRAFVTQSTLTPLISVMSQFAVNFPSIIQRFVSVAGF
jgi:hypothetical protein